MAARPKPPDPPSALRELERSLAGAPLKRAYLVRGAERYFREKAAARIRERAGELGLEICSHDASDPGFALDLLLGDLTTASMFAGERLVALRGTLHERRDLLAKQEGEDSPLTRAMRAFLAEGGLPGTLLVVTDSLRADHAVAKAALAAGGVLLDLRKLYDSPPPWMPSADPSSSELAQWIAGRAREMKLELAPGQCGALATRVGNDLQALDGALEKLALLGPAELASSIGYEASRTPWQVADAVARGDLGPALAGVEGLFRGGFEEKDGSRLVDPRALSAMLAGAIVRSVRQALACVEASARGLTSEDLVAAAGLSPVGRGAEEAFARAARRTREQWLAMFDEALDLERRPRLGGRVDVNDFARFAVRWRHSARPPARTAVRR